MAAAASVTVGASLHRSRDRTAPVPRVPGWLRCWRETELLDFPFQSANCDERAQFSQFGSADECDRNRLRNNNHRKNIMWRPRVLELVKYHREESARLIAVASDSHRARRETETGKGNGVWVRDRRRRPPVTVAPETYEITESQVETDERCPSRHAWTRARGSFLRPAVLDKVCPTDPTSPQASLSSVAYE